MAHSGSGYVDFFSNRNIGSNSRDYIEAPLIAPLNAGKCYWVSFFVSTTDYFGYATNNIAAHLFSGSPSATNGNGEVLPYKPDIMLYGNPIIKDTANWVRVFGIYEALGNEDKICIGNFFDDAHTDTSFIALSYNSAAYYLDDVSVTPLDSIVHPHFAGDSSITITLGDSVYIGTLMNGLTDVRWFNQQGQQIADSVPGLWVKPTTTSTYYTVVVNTCTKTYTDTTHVEAKPAGIHEEEMLGKAVKIAPNPSRGAFVVTLPAGTWQLRLTNVQGQSVYNSGVASGTQLLNTSLPAGTYFLQAIEKSSGVSVTTKAIIY